jgi:glycine/D-amino acid oxidase-like deaminating enzyme/nitrite reductase/ring-hydroxylating ferredoxin subunit
MQDSIWLETELPRFAPLSADESVDVVVVGGGLTGITTAYLLAREGRRVALLERDRLAAADTGHTTAHLTYVTDSRLHDISARFGNDGAKAFWEAGAAAIDGIASNVAEVGAECGFRWTPGYLHAPLSAGGGPSEVGGKERERLQRDAQLAHEFGFDAAYVDSVPGAGVPGVRFGGQATFHPRRYLAGLLDAIVAAGGLIYENTAFESVEDGPTRVHANGHRIRCDYLVIATHTPLMGKRGLLGAALFQTKLALYTSYVLGARLPAGTLPTALYWDTSDPYEYLRVDPTAAGQFAIFGGMDVKTGQGPDTDEVFRKLEERLRLRIPDATPTHRWLGQVVETDDGLPFIGENASREFIATGFCGNGFTLGTLAAMMARDRYLGRPNPWFELFRVDRRPAHGGLWRYVTENFDYPYYLLRDRIGRSGCRPLEELKPGEGSLVIHDGRKLAASRDSSGKVTLLSPVCTHMGCLVRWNGAARTWDCPCHGSRFRATGEVIGGPAEEGLRPWPEPGT